MGASCYTYGPLGTIQLLSSDTFFLQGHIYGLTGNNEGKQPSGRQKLFSPSEDHGEKSLFDSLQNVPDIMLLIRRVYNSYMVRRGML
jgi:hypothetical protein